MRLHGRALSFEALAARTGDVRAHAGARLVEHLDGSARGTRVIEIATGGGLAFSIVVDRGFDLGAAALHGVPFAWASATGLRAPALMDAESEAGLGLLRGYTGLMTTCGLDHTGGPAETDGERYAYALRTRIQHPLHGRISHEPARLIGYGEDWEAGHIWAEGEVTQAAVFGENLVLRRRITAPIGAAHITIVDTVTNRGFAPTPHMLLYHVNLGWPLLDEGARYVAPISRVLSASHATVPGLAAQDVGWSEVPEPRWPFQEQVWEHALVPDARGMASAMLVNDALFDGRGLGVRVAADRATLPRHLVWQAFAKGLYALGIEPATNHADGRAAAEAHGELTILAPGEARRYRVEIDALTGETLREAETALRTLAPGPAARFPKPVGVR